MARYDWGRGYGRMEGDGYGSDYSGRGGAWESGAGGRLWGRDGGMNRFWGIGEGGGRSGYDRGVYGDYYPTYGGYPGGDRSGMYYGGRAGYDGGMSGGGQRPGWGGRGYDWGLGYGAGPEAYGDMGGGFRPGGSGMGPRGYDPGFRGLGVDYTGARGIGGGYRGGPAGGHGSGRGGYDSGYAREPFVPEEAYLRHPEMTRPRDHLRGRWPEYGHGSDSGAAEPDDDEVRQAVKQNLHQDNWIHPDRITVVVHDGVVTLTGDVDDYMEARYAWDDAWETEGVRGVINNLTVRTDQPHEPHGDVVPQTSGGKRKK